MFPGPAEPLFTADARRSWITHNIPQSVWQTQSGAAILRELSEQGLGIRRTDFFAVRREVLDLGRYEDQILDLQPDSLVPRSWMHERPYTELTSKAQYRYKMTVTDLDTGESKVITRALSSNRHLTPQEATDMVRGLFTIPSATSNYQVDEVDLFEVWVRPGAILDR